MEQGRIPLLVPHGVEDSIMMDRESLNMAHETDMVMCTDDSTIAIKRELCSEDKETVLELCRAEGLLENQNRILCKDEKIFALKSDGEEIKTESIDYRLDKGYNEGLDMIVKSEDVKVETDNPADPNTESGPDRTISRVLLTLSDKPNVVVDSFFLRSSKPDNSEVNLEKDSQSGPLLQTPCRHHHLPCLIALLNAPISNYRVSVPQDRVSRSQDLSDDSSLVQDALPLASTAKSKDSNRSEYEVKKYKDLEIPFVNMACYKDEEQKTAGLCLCDRVPSPTVLVETPKVSMSDACYRDGGPSSPDTSWHLTDLGPLCTVLDDTETLSKQSLSETETADISRDLTEGAPNLSLSKASYGGGQTATPSISRYFPDPVPPCTVLEDTPKLPLSGASYGGGQTETTDISRHLTDPDPSSTVLADTPKVSLSEVCHRGGQTETTDISLCVTDPGPSSTVLSDSRKISDGEIKSRRRNLFSKNRDRNDLDKVGASHNSGSEQYICETSPKEFNSSSDLQGHLKIYNVKKPPIFNAGAEQMSQCAEVSYHEKSLSAPIPLYGICFEELSSSTSSDLQALERVNSGSKSYKCDVCSKQFSTSWNLNTHQRVHSGGKPFKCEVCSKRFSRSGNFKRHKRVHSGSKPYKCDVCSKQFSQSFHLKLHGRIHSGSKPYKCDLCSKQFSRSSYLKAHETVHSGCKRYQCDVCFKQFSQPSALNTHQRVHSGRKPYKCDICSKHFSTSSYLKVHERVHSGIRPFKCDVCSKLFSTSSNLNTHEKVHSGSKPYKCDVCSKQFSTKSNLKVHQRVHSSGSPY